MRRRYPQIYDSTDKLLIDVNNIKVLRGDFVKAMKSITPAAHRSATTYAASLSPSFRPLLESQLKELMEITQKIFGVHGNVDTTPSDDEYDDEEEDVNKEKEEDEIRGTEFSSRKLLADSGIPAFTLEHPVHRPRVLVHGSPELGQAQLTAALLHGLERFPVFSLDLASLCSDTVAKVKIFHNPFL